MLLSLALPCSAKTVNISNVASHVDTNGDVMDIHDGNTVLVDGVYYYYGASYGLCRESSGSSGCANTTIGACGFRSVAASAPPVAFLSAAEYDRSWLTGI